MQAVQVQELPHQTRRVIDCGSQLIELGAVGRKHRIAAGRAQLGQRARHLVAYQIAPVDLIRVGNRHEQANGQAALVVLEQVHVSGADVERARHLSLGLLAGPPELPQLGTDEGFGHAMPFVYNITNSTLMFANNQHINAMLNAKRPAAR